MAQFYTYLWLRENGTPYYAGKGSKRRAFKRHRRIGEPPSLDRIIVQEFESEQDAFDAECFLISFYARKQFGGLLCNLTDGGEGPAGQKMSLEFCRKNRERAIARGFGKQKPTKESIEKMRLKLLGKKRAPEVVEHMRQWMIENNPFRGKKHSEETKSKMRIAKSGHKMPNQSEAQQKRHLAHLDHLKRIGILGRQSRWGTQSV